MIKKNRAISKASGTLFVALMVTGWMLAQSPQDPGAKNGSRQKEEPFVLIMTGPYSLPDGTIMGFRVFKAAKDDSRADIKDGIFDSPDLAAAELRRWLSFAPKTSDPAKIEKRTDSSGKIIGERVVDSFKDANEKTVFRVMWTEGSNFYVISSISLETALKLEKWLK